MSGGEHAARHREVDRVDRSGEDLDRLAVRLRCLSQLRERAHRTDESGPHSTSTIASISTVIPNGRLPMPTAERACFSPNTSTKRSEHPLIT